MQRLKKILTSRLLGIGILVVAQVLFLFLLIYQASLYYQIYPIFYIFGIVLVIYIINRQEDPSYKIAWCIVILIVPLFGGFLYLLCGGRKVPKKLHNGTTQASARMQHLLEQDTEALKKMDEGDPTIAKLFHYGLKSAGFPVYSHTESKYFSSGEEYFPVLAEELKKAEKFIFIEMFIIDEGYMWNTILEILQQKVKEGVEVKLIYDDFGCAVTLPNHYDRKLNAMGIETYRFNHMRPALVVQMNNRDHRKIIVIDNKVGFTGGLNFADEYINRIVRFGYWKDSGIMIKGDAVRSLTVMFLGIYSYLKNDEDSINYSRYCLDCHKEEGQGLVQPYSDTPTDGEDIGLSMHLNMVNHARKYLYIDTPYLIINADMQRALMLAVKNGVDVRICTPHIPDKPIVFQITRSNYLPLIRAGVRIYEYTPGFNHAKNFVSDDELAIVGTVNTDYRSYYLHFEDGILLYDVPAVKEMKNDFLQSIEKGKEVTLDDCLNVNVFVRILRAILNLMTPLV